MRGMLTTAWDSKGKIGMAATALAAMGYIYTNLAQPHRGLKNQVGFGLVPSDSLYTSEN
jgi:hypothetical protein